MKFGAIKPAKRNKPWPATCIALAASLSAVLPVPSRAENPPPPIRDMLRLARGELEIARLRALQRFDRSTVGKSLSEQVQAWEARLAAAIAGQSDADQVAAATGLQNARTALDAARQTAIDADPAVRAAAAKVTEPREGQTRP